MDYLILIEADVTKPTTTTAASGADMDDLILIKADVTEARRTKPRLPLAPTWTTWILKPNKSEVLWFTLPVSKYKHNWAYDKGKVQRRTAALELYGTMLLFSLLVDFQQGLTPQQLHNPPHGVGIPPTAATGADMGATHKCATIIIHIPLMTTARAMPHGPQPRHEEVAMFRSSGGDLRTGPTPRIATWQSTSEISPDHFGTIGQTSMGLSGISIYAPLSCSPSTHGKGHNKNGGLLFSSGSWHKAC